MAAPLETTELILSNGQVLVKQADSRLGITDTPSGFLFGEVVSVCQLSDNVVVGQFVLFNPEEAISSFKISVLQCWIIKEDRISINEGVTPP
jgi:hypothetical protein